MKQTKVYIPEVIMAEIDIEKARTGAGLSDVVRLALLEYFERRGRMKTISNGAAQEPGS